LLAEILDVDTAFLCKGMRRTGDEHQLVLEDELGVEFLILRPEEGNAKSSSRSFRSVRRLFERSHFTSRRTPECSVKKD
jgi:hypothetical protein